MTTRTATILIAVLSAVIIGEIAYFTAPIAGQLTARVSRQSANNTEAVVCLPELSQCRNDCQAAFDSDPAQDPAGCYENCEEAFQSCRGDGG